MIFSLEIAGMLGGMGQIAKCIELMATDNHAADFFWVPGAVRDRCVFALRFSKFNLIDEINPNLVIFKGCARRVNPEQTDLSFRRIHAGVGEPGIEIAVFGTEEVIIFRPLYESWI